MTESRTTLRNKAFQMQPNDEEIKHYREERNVELRKKKRIEQVNKRRHINQGRDTLLRFDVSWICKELANMDPSLQSVEVDAIHKVIILLELATTASLSCSISAINAVHVFFSNNNCCSNLDFISPQACENLVDKLHSPSEALQLGTLKVISNLFLWEPVNLRLFKDTPLFSILLDFLESRSEEIINESLTVIHNYLYEFRVQCVECNILTNKLSVILSNSTNNQNTLWVSWILKLLSQEKLDMKSAAPIFKMETKLVRSANLDVFVPALEALAELTQKFPGFIQETLSFATLILKHLEDPRINVALPAIKIIGSLINGDDNQTQTIINLGLIEKLVRCLKHHNATMRKECVFCIGNLIVGPDAQAEAILNSPGLNIARLLRDTNAGVVSEAIYLVSNIISIGSKTMTLKLITQDVDLGMFYILKFAEEDSIVSRTLVWLNKLLVWFKSNMPREDWSQLLEKLESNKAIETVERIGEKVHRKLEPDYRKLLSLLELDEALDVPLQTPIKFSFS